MGIIFICISFSFSLLEIILTHEKKVVGILLLLSPSGLSLGFYGLHMVVMFWFVDVF